MGGMGGGTATISKVARHVEHTGTSIVENHLTINFQKSS